VKVIKIGGGCLKGKKNIEKIIEPIADRGRGHIFVVSALSVLKIFELTNAFMQGKVFYSTLLFNSGQSGEV